MRREIGFPGMMLGSFLVIALRIQQADNDSPSPLHVLRNALLDVDLELLAYEWMIGTHD